MLPIGSNISRYDAMDAKALLTETLLARPFGRTALVSSFGTESAVLLHMVSRIDPNCPVLFLDTNKLFGETIWYQQKLAAKLGLSRIVRLCPDPEEVACQDPSGALWRDDPDRCCHLRKTVPLDAALEGYDAWITGRKRYQGGDRARLPAVEWADGRYKINPLADWQREDIEAYFSMHDLPRHPLERSGFPSVGCLPCTDKVAPGEDLRSGRWRGREKTECGIHLSAGSSSPRLPRR